MWITKLKGPQHLQIEAVVRHIEALLSGYFMSSSIHSTDIHSALEFNHHHQKNLILAQQQTGLWGFAGVKNGQWLSLQPRGRGPVD